MEQNDHKEIGRALGLFSFNRKVPGTVLWHPKGAMLFDLIVGDLKKELAKEGYQDLRTSTIIDLDTLKSSGHYDNYREKLFFTGNEKEMDEKKVDWCLKPMNCPGSIAIFNAEMRSYKDLPVKFSEVGTVFRYEQPGEVNGLLRTRALTIDDAHIFCNEDQMEAELIKLIKFIQNHYQKFEFKDIRVELSTKPEKSIGTKEQWEKAEKGLIKALEESKMEYKENPGDGAFYGPKIDFHVKDSAGRSWQMGTIQLDFSTAERLDANYIDEKGEKKHPVIIHRAILGSVERFTAVLLEHTGGALPVWLAPTQAIVLPIADRHIEYAEKVAEELKAGDIRVEVDHRNETIGKKIREAEMQKIPNILIVGDKEIEAKKVALRKYGEGDKGQVGLNEIIKQIKE